jgi:hypothetical protein
MNSISRLYATTSGTSLFGIICSQRVSVRANLAEMIERKARTLIATLPLAGLCA